MAESFTPVEDPDVPLFDVVVKMPSGVRLQDVDRLAREAGIQPDRVDSLVRALRDMPQVKIGTAVSRERADKAREQFSRTGLTVEVTPVLSVQALVTGSFDGSFVCPSCKTRVLLPSNRQCPSCGVFVDKVTDEVLLKRKIRVQERDKLDFQASRDARDGEKRTRESMEAALREKIREELEARYGLNGRKGLFRGKAGLLRAGALVGLLLVAFAGGKGVTAGGWSLDQLKSRSGGQAAKGSSSAEVDKMLDSIGTKGAGAAGASDGLATDLGLDADDPVLQAANGKPPGGKGLTIEQAVAAAQVLARSVGVGKAEGAQAGAGGAPDQRADAGAGAAQAAIPGRVKQQLSLVFAKQLAEMGQLPRAFEVIKTLRAAPTLAADPVVAAAARVTEMEIKAWALSSLQEGRAREAADALMAEAGRMPDPAERSQVLTRVAVILSRHPQLPGAASRAFLTQASESLKAIPDARQRVAAISAWAVALGETLLAEATSKAKAGNWSKAQAAGLQLEALIRQAPDASSQVRLYAIDSQIKQQRGQQDKAAESLSAALALADKIGSVSERAATLRDVARLSGGAADERMRAALNALQSQAASKTGTEQAQALTHLALLYADAGLRTKSGELGQLARSTGGLSPDEAILVNTDLIVRGDLAKAKVMHGIGLYAESEVVLRGLAGYLL